MGELAPAKAGMQLLQLFQYQALCPISYVVLDHALRMSRRYIHQTSQDQRGLTQLTASHTVLVLGLPFQQTDLSSCSATTCAFSVAV